MKKGYTIVDILVIVVVLGVLATITLPVYNKIIRRARMREVVTLIALTRVGARYYDGKYGITSLTTPGNIAALNVDLPPDPVCTYEIVDLDDPPQDPPRRWLQVNSSGDWLYRYQLPTGSGTINTDNPDSRYVQDLP